MTDQQRKMIAAFVQLGGAMAVVSPAGWDAMAAGSEGEESMSRVPDWLREIPVQPQAPEGENLADVMVRKLAALLPSGEESRSQAREIISRELLRSVGESKENLATAMVRQLCDLLPGEDHRRTRARAILLGVLLAGR